MDNQKCINRFDQVAQKRTTIQETWDLIEEYVTYYRGRFFRDQRDEHSIEWRNRKAWDSTAPMAHQNLAASLHGSLTSPSTRWFDIRFRDEALNKDKVAAKWLKNASDRVYYELQDSNFNLEINECYQDIVGYGTGFLTQEQLGNGDDWQGMVFSGVPLKEAYFEEDDQGRARYFYRLLKWTPGQIIAKFGEEGVPEWIKRMDQSQPNDRTEVLFVIYPRNEDPAPLGQILAPERRPIGYKYILKKDGTSLGEEGGYYEMPVFTPRWRKTSESMWGNSPAMFALADILTLNAWVEILTIWSEKQTDPPILAEEKAIITDLNLDARSLTVVRNIDGIKEWTTGTSIAVAMEGIDQLRANIRNYFFTDQINYPDPQAQPMTATEAQIRYELMQRLLGPTLGRLQSDLLNPIVARTFNMLARANQLGDIPENVASTGAAMDVEYLGALARAQRVDQAAAVERWVGSLAAVAEVVPGVLDVIDEEEVARGLGHQLNIDPAMMRDEAEVKRIRDEREAARDAAAMAELGQMQGESAKAQGEGAQAIEEAGGEPPVRAV